MAVADALIDQELAVESGRIGRQIHERTLFDSPWLALPKQDTWEDEMGQSITVPVYERSLPASISAWDIVGQSNIDSINTGAGGACLPPVDEVPVARQDRTFELYHYALESPVFCVKDLRIATRRVRQVRAIFNMLKENVKYAWINRRRDEYERLAENKITLYGGGSGNPNGVNPPSNASAFPAVNAPDSQLTNQMLSVFGERIVREGGRDGAASIQNGRPTFIAVVSPDTMRNLKVEDSDVREDFRNSSAADELLRGFAVTHTYNGFVYLVDDFSPRYSHDSGAFTRIDEYTSTATTYGNKMVPSTTYRAADFEVTYVFHSMVMKSNVPAPIASVGNMMFNADNYRGTVRWINEYERTNNPDRTWGYFRAVLEDASEPILPQLGYAVMHSRTDPSNLYRS